MSFDTRLLLSIEKQENEDAKSLIQSKELHKKRDAAGNTLLHYAAEYGNREIVQFLVEAGSAVNVRNNNGQTPLMRSIESDSSCIQVIKFLLEAGVYLGVNDAADRRVRGTINSSEWLNKDAGRFEILKTIIERADLCIYEMDYVEILRYGNKEDIRSLLQTNVDLSAIDSKGQSLIHILAMNSNPGVIESLHGRNFDINMRDSDGATPLLNAVFEPTPSSVEFFLKNGADISDVFCMTGDIPDLYEILEYMMESRGWSTTDKDIVQLLLEHGVKPHSDARNEDSSLFSDFWHDNMRHDMAEIVLAHMAFQEALGTAITDVDRMRINRYKKYKTYFERCQKQLRNKVICPTVTMFDALTASERKLERLFRNQELASKLSDFKTSTEYFNTRLRKRFEKANRMVKLRKTVTGVVSELMEIYYDMYPDVIDEVISYLSEEDIDQVAKVN